MRIMVTGASGTLGSNIVNMLAARDRSSSITVVVRAPQRDLFPDLPNVTTRVLDVRDIGALRTAVLEERPRAIVHCAASGVRPSESSWFDMIDVNVNVTLALFEASCRLARCHFVHVSTGLVYREQKRALLETDAVDPVHPYGVSKAAADSLLRSGAERLQRRVTIVRPFSFTGPCDRLDRLFPSLLRCAENQEPFAMSAGTQIRDFCSVRDVARAVCVVMDRTDDGIEVYNVGSGISAPLRQIVEEVCDRLSLRVDVRFGALKVDPLEPMHLVADISKLCALGWRPEQSVASAVRELALLQYPRALGRASTLAYG